MLFWSVVTIFDISIEISKLLQSKFKIVFWVLRLKQFRCILLDYIKLNYYTHNQISTSQSSYMTKKYYTVQQLTIQERRISCEHD